MRRLALAVALVVLTAAGAQAFDGNRKGFVLGGGLGFAPVGAWKLDNTPADEARAGIGLNLLLGYAWDEKNMIVYEGNVVGYTSNVFRLAGQNKTVSQGFNGAAWYHYFGRKGRSWFSVAGLGIYSMDVEGFSANNPGAGILLGGGFEFAAHYQVGLYLSTGKTSDGPADFTNSHLSVLFNAIAF